jgi:hypothetical protein
MDEQEKKEETKGSEEKETNANSNIGQSEQAERDVLAESKKIVDELKKQNEEKKKLLDREEKLLARQETLRALGGGSPAGQIPQPPKTDSPKEYADKVMRGEIKGKQ